MFRKRYRRQIPELNTTSTADISFMLLIFFLVTSSMDTDKGLLRQMAPPPMEQQQPTDINKELVVKVELDAQDHLTCDGKPTTLKELSDAVSAMVNVSRTGHVVSVQADRETSYEAYFQVQNTIVNTYQALRERYAVEHYGKSYARLGNDDRTDINAYYPQRISEMPIEEGGAR
jgi:biopolymer transport protein ExbD